MRAAVPKTESEILFEIELPAKEHGPDYWVERNVVGVINKTNV
jgi:hypothetical protein